MDVTSARVHSDRKTKKVKALKHRERAARATLACADDGKELVVRKGVPLLCTEFDLKKKKGWSVHAHGDSGTVRRSVLSSSPHHFRPFRAMTSHGLASGREVVKSVARTGQALPSSCHNAAYHHSASAYCGAAGERERRRDARNYDVWVEVVCGTRAGSVDGEQYLEKKNTVQERKCRTQRSVSGSVSPSTHARATTLRAASQYTENGTKKGKNRTEHRKSTREGTAHEAHHI